MKLPQRHWQPPWLLVFAAAALPDYINGQCFGGVGILIISFIILIMTIVFLII